MVWIRVRWLSFAQTDSKLVNHARQGDTVFKPRGEVGSSALNPRASRIEDAVVLSLLPISLPRRSSTGDATMSSESSIAEDDSLGGAYDQENRRDRLGSGAARGGEPLLLLNKVEKEGF